MKGKKLVEYQEVFKGYKLSLDEDEMEYIWFVLGSMTDQKIRDTCKSCARTISDAQGKMFLNMHFRVFQQLDGIRNQAWKED